MKQLRQSLCLMLTLMLALSGMAASAESGPDTSLDQGFIPQRFFDGLNHYINYAVERVCDTPDSASIEAICQYLHLNYSDTSGSMIFYDNSDWMIEAAAYYYDGNVEEQSPADELILAFSDELDGGVAMLLKSVLSFIVQDLDNSASSMETYDWLHASRRSGDVLRLNGFLLVVQHEDGHWQYALTRA